MRFLLQELVVVSGEDGVDAFESLLSISISRTRDEKDRN